jgi:oligopeptide transport system substrate-binding protein
VAYLSLAGDHARLAYAQEEALAHYERALKLLGDGRHDDRAARLLMKIGLVHHAAFDFRAAELAYSEGFTRWRYTQQREGATLPEAPHALRLVWYPPQTLDPAMCRDIGSGCLIEQLHSGLVDLTPEMTVVPDVATDWQIAKGGCEYTFRLRQDVCWTDGAPVTAHDFAYAWRRVLDPALGSPSARMLYDIKGAEAYHQGYGHSEDVGVRAEGNHTLVVELEQPACQFLYLLTYTALLPVPYHVLEAHGGAWDETVDYVGNGPFKLGPRRTKDRVVLIPNRVYHGTCSGNVSQVEIRLADPPAWASGLADYAADMLDIYALTELSPSEMARALGQHATDHVAAPALVAHFFVFDTAHPPFDDLRIRRAFTMALDRAQLASLVTAGTMAPALGGLLPAGMPGHSPGIGLPHDPAQARSLLAEAGYLGGDRFPPVRVLTAPGPITDAFTEEACAQWRQKLGIEVTIHGTRDWSEFYRRLPSEVPSLFSGGWLADYPDPDNFLRVGLPSQMVSWQNEAYRHLVEEATRCQDQAQRLARYREADRILVEEAPVLPLVYQRWHLLIKPWVTRYPVSPQRCWFWKDVVIEPH